MIPANAIPVCAMRGPVAHPANVIHAIAGTVRDAVLQIPDAKLVHVICGFRWLWLWVPVLQLGSPSAICVPSNIFSIQFRMISILCALVSLVVSFT